MKIVFAGVIVGVILAISGISSANNVAVNGDLTLTAPDSGIVFPGGGKQTEAITSNTYQKRVAAPCNTGYAVTAIDPSGNVTCTPVDGNWLRTDNNISTTNTGNVGIGTTTPTSPLTVAGTIETTSGGVKFPDGTVQTSVGDCHGRYEDNGDGTVSDCRTGLIWLKNANCTDTVGGVVKSNGILTWADAVTWSAALGNNLCGLSDGSYAGDWRLPTRTEWMAMLVYAKSRHYTTPALTNAAGTGQWAQNDPFLNVQAGLYWSSSTYAGYAYSAWYVSMIDGLVDSSNRDYFSSLYVWPVRSGQ